MPDRRFPPPWSIDEAFFIVRDSTGQALGYFYFDDGPVAARRPSCSPSHEARRIYSALSQADGQRDIKGRGPLG